MPLMPEWLFLSFLPGRLDSLPLASERFGELGRFRMLPETRWLRTSTCFLRPEGVLVPLLDAPEPILSPSRSLPLPLSRPTLASSRWRSSLA